MLSARPSWRSAALLLVFGAAAAGAWWWGQRSATSRRSTAESSPTAAPEPDRVALARQHVEAEMRELCRGVGLPYPPAALFLRALKREAEMEVWACGPDGPFRLLEVLPITASSGQPGPKRKEGDLQVPEGFYEIDLFNPKSSFHLSLRVNYPNASDRILSDPEAPGSDIYIHGKDCSVGCLPLGDRNIERLYILALDTTEGGQQRIPIHIFPTRMQGEAWTQFAREHAERSPSLAPFWKTLQAGYEVFEETRQLPQIRVLPDGVYAVE